MVRKDYLYLLVGVNGLMASGSLVGLGIVCIIYDAYYVSTAVRDDQYPVGYAGSWLGLEDDKVVWCLMRCR